MTQSSTPIIQSSHQTDRHDHHRKPTDRKYPPGDVRCSSKFSEKLSREVSTCIR